MVASLKMIHISKTGSENDLNIGNQTRQIQYINLGTNLEKTRALMIFTKYFHSYENESRKDVNFRLYNCIFM